MNIKVSPRFVGMSNLTLPVREANMHFPVLPTQDPSLELIADTLRLNDMKWLECVADFESRIVLSDLLRKVVVRGTWRCESLSKRSLNVSFSR